MKEILTREKNWFSVMILNFRIDRFGQTVQNEIRLVLEE